MSIDGFHDRLREAVGDRPIREVAELVGLHPEHMRRILGGKEPPADQVARICTGLDLSADWLLLGRGPMHRSELRSEALQHIPAEDLLGSLKVHVREQLEPAVTSASPQVAPAPASDAGGGHAG
jgi:hypothetical protein